MAALPSELLPAPRRSTAPAPGVRRNLRLAPAPRRFGRYIAVMVVLGAMGVFGSVALNALAAEQSFAARELEADVAELTRTVDELTVDVTRLESPTRLHRSATRRLGMVRADEPAYVVLDGGASAESRSESRTIAAPASAAGD